MRGIFDKGKRVRVEAVSDKRSHSQNAVYWMWLTCIHQHTGNDKNDLHDYFRGKFIGCEDLEIFDSRIAKLKSTTSLNTALFAQYLTQIQVFALVECGIDLPDPADKRWKEFEDFYKNFI